MPLSTYFAPFSLINRAAKLFSMYDKPFTNQLRDHRIKQGLLQRDVASLLGLDCVNRLSRWENGRAMPSVVNLFKLAALYKTEPQALYPELFKSPRACT